MLSFTVDNLIGIIIGLGSLAAFGWGFYKYVDGKIDRVRKEADHRIESTRTEFAMDLLRVEGDLKSLRSECVRRDEVKRVEDGIVNLSARLDRLTEVILQQMAKS